MAGWLPGNTWPLWAILPTYTGLARIRYRCPRLKGRLPPPFGRRVARGGVTHCRRSSSCLEQPHAIELQIQAVDRAHPLRLVLVDGERPLLGDIADRCVAPHPQALALGGGDLVPDALAGDFALELREGEQDVERQPPHGIGRIELLGDRDERHPVGIEQLDHLREVRERSGQAVHLVHHHHADLACLDVGQQPLQSRALERCTGAAAIVIGARHRPPPQGLLALNIGGAGLALGIQGIEVLFQAFLGRLAGIDRAGNGFQGRSPKKRGPDHAVPVIARVIAVRLR